MASFWATFGITLAIFILTSGHTGNIVQRCLGFNDLINQF